MKLKELMTKSYMRQVLSFLAVFILAQFVIIIVMFGSFQHSANRQREELASKMTAGLDETISRSVEQAETDLQQLMALSIDARVLSGKQQNARVLVANDISKTLSNFIASTKATDVYIVYNAINDIFLLSRSANVEYSELTPLRGYAMELSQSYGVDDSGWHIADIGGKNYLLHWYYYYDCYFIAAFHLDSFLDMGAYEKLFEGSACISIHDAEGNVLANAGERELLCSDGGLYVSSRPLSCGNLSASYTSRRDFAAGADSLPIFIMAVCLSSLLLLLLFVKYLRHEILQPIEEISATTHIVKQGDFTKRAELECASPEFKELADSVNTMIDTIINQRIASYENDIKQKNLELKYLQMQLKPHHFLNTLSTISSMSRLGDNERIRKFVELYSRDARYMFSVSFRAVPLEDEIQHVQDYIECQSILYPDCVFSFVEIQEEAYGWLIPQMMLHTLVENVYKHAVSLDRFTSFFISAKLREIEGEQMLEIIVEDNGMGFPQEVIDRVNSSDGELPGASHIGLMNISHTLYLMYRRTHLMELSNKKDSGSMVKVLIPKETYQ